MKFIFNGNFFDEADALFGKINRAFQWGDFIKETVKMADGKPLLWEEHYFNLMASMRIFRMKIPTNFTQEFFEDEIQKLAKENQISNAKVQISIYRNADKKDLLTQSTVSYLVEIVEVHSSPNYNWKNEFSEIEIFKEYTVNPSFFTQVNSHKPEEIIARAFMQENEYTDLVLLNPEKRIARTLLGNPFLIQGNQIKTPKISEGGIRSVTRNHLCKLIEKSGDFTLEETDIFPFELQKTEEVFICLESEGILSIHQNRKKNYTTEKTKEVFRILESEI